MRVLLQKLTFANNCCTIEQNAAYLMRALLQKLIFANICCTIEQNATYLTRAPLQKLTFANICCTIEQNATYLTRAPLQKLTFANNCCTIEQNATYLMRALLQKLTFVGYCRKRPFLHGTWKLTTIFTTSLHRSLFDRYYSIPHPHSPLILRLTITFSYQLRLGLRSRFCFLSAPHIFLIAKFSACFFPLPHKHNVASHSSTIYVVFMYVVIIETKYCCGCCTTVTAATGHFVAW
jgi:hypothetical protein